MAQAHRTYIDPIDQTPATDRSVFSRKAEVPELPRSDPPPGAMGAVALAASPAYIRPVTASLYNRDILRLAASIPHQRRLEQPQASVEKRSPICGSRVVVDVDMDAQGRVAALGLEVRACALGQASASLMATHAIGRSPRELAEARDSLAAYLAGSRDDPGGWPGLAVFADARGVTARHGSILLAFDAAAEAAERAPL